MASVIWSLLFLDKKFVNITLSSKIDNPVDTTAHSDRIWVSVAVTLTCGRLWGTVKTFEA